MFHFLPRELCRNLKALCNCGYADFSADKQTDRERYLVPFLYNTDFSKIGRFYQCKSMNNKFRIILNNFFCHKHNIIRPVSFVEVLDEKYVPICIDISECKDPVHPWIYIFV